MMYRYWLLGIALLLVVSTGCGSHGTAGPIADAPRVTVVYESNPLADVHVRLLASMTGPELAQAITSADGHAHFPSLPSPEPDQYFVSLESSGDGGWILDTKFADAGKNGLTLRPFSEASQQQIELPRNAVRSLELGGRR
jgi:hypothetical protein